MKKYWAMMGVAVVALAALMPALAEDKKAEPTEPKWHESFEEAKALAKKENKPLLLDFTGSDWCPPCKQLKAKVFDSAEFKQWAAAKVVLVELDFPRRKEQNAEVKKQNEKLAKEFKIEGFPTVIILDATGKERARQVGYSGAKPADWIKKIEADAK